MKNRRDIFYFIKKSLSSILVLFCCTSLFANEPLDYKKVKCIIHIHTDISSGTESLESYIREAEDKGIEAIVLTDNDWRRWEYGFKPLRRWIKKVVQEKSVMTFGIEEYLNLIKEVNEKKKDVIVIDGVQTNPFYFWSGNFFKGTMTLNNRNKDMLVIGLGDADYYRDMPLVANGISRFDAYHGDQFTRPYQDLIDYVVERGGLIFWSHPEYKENFAIGRIASITPPYNWDLIGTYGYTGFGISYKETIEPMGIWDRILTEYCQGRRKTPAWVIGELEEEGTGKRLDEMVNIIYIRDLNRRDILDALRRGRFYVKDAGWEPLTLEEFSISDESGSKTAVMGEEASFSGDPVIRIRVLVKEKLDRDIVVTLIRNNKVIDSFREKSEIDIAYKDEGLPADKKYYYRIDVRSCGHIVTNPIFFKKISE